ncbi:TYDP2 phosphodiesterase, partial [Atractosteus spatula]|nr:TYDP2 phosphodiesterase [Atractosteus spatula]
MLKKSRVTLLDSEIVKYTTTEIMRNLLIAQVNVCCQELYLMTSHLESCKANSQLISSIVFHSSPAPTPCSSPLKARYLLCSGLCIGSRIKRIGLEKLGCSCFVSDHWGILCSFTVQA